MVLSDFSIKRPISISMIVLAIMILGLVSISGIPLSLLPDVTFPRVTVRTEYPQAAPAEVENIVTRPIEQVVGILNNVQKITSVSKSGMSDVVVEFGWDTDIDLATMEMREKLQLLQFPDDVKKPLILRYDPAQDPVMTLGITADIALSDLRYLVEREIQRELERIDGVAAVRVQGGYEEEILVALDEAKMSHFGVSAAQIIDKLKRENVNIAGGTLKDAGAELAVRTTNAFVTLDDIRDIIIQVGGTGLPIASTGTQEEGQAGGMLNMLSMMGLVPGSLPSASSLPTAALTPSARPSEIRLVDIATVTRRPKQRTEIARLDNRECIQVSIFKEGDANVVSVCRNLRRTIERIKGQMRMSGAVAAIPTWSEIFDTMRRSPGEATQLLAKKFGSSDEQAKSDEKLIGDLKIFTIVDQADFVEKAIDEVYSGAFWGGVIAIIVIYIFLRSWKSTFIVALNIPISIVATFVLMYFFDISWNIMSLGGLALGVGILDDNTVVVLENIYRIREQEGGDLRETAARGASQVWTAVTASTLTNIVVFLPIIFIAGIAGRIFRDLALTVTFSMIMSQVTAFTIVPMLATVFKISGASFGYGGTDEGVKKEAGPGSIAGYIHSRWYKAMKGVLSRIFQPFLKAFDRGFGAIRHGYPRLLEWTVDHPFQVLFYSLALSAASVLGIFSMGTELMPSVDQGEFTIHVEMSAGTPIETTNEKLMQVESAIRIIEETPPYETENKGRRPEIEVTTHSPEACVEHMFTAVGYGATRTEGVQQKSQNIAEIIVTLEEERLFDDLAVMRKLRSLARDSLLGAEVKMRRPTLLSYSTPIEIEIAGSNLEELKRYADTIASSISDVPGLIDVESSGRESNPEVQVTVDREKAARYGLTVAQVTDAIRRKVKGEVATDIDEGERQVDVLVQVREEDRKSLTNLADMAITTPGVGSPPVSLKLVADISPSLGPGIIHRSGNSRVALVTADISGRPLGDIVRDIKGRLDMLPRRPGYYTRIAGQNEEMRKALFNLAGAVILAIFLVYIVLASSFESLVHPFVIMFTVPYSLIGVAIMMMPTGTTLNVFTFIGMMMMIGIAVNDAILFVETINQYRAEGMDRRGAIVLAGKNRLRPMIITSLTTVLGMIPMAVIGGEGAEFRAPIAIACIGGLISSTLLTVTCVPAIYEIFDRLRPGKGAYTPKTPDSRIA